MQTSPFKSAVNYGAIYALGCFAVFITVYWMGFNPIGEASVFAIWIPPLIIYLSIRYYRNHLNGGIMTFGYGMQTGMLTAASGGLLYALMVYIFCKVIDPSVIEEYKEQLLNNLEQTEQMMISIMGEDMYNKSVEDLKNINLGSQVMSEYMAKLFSGVIYSLIASAILKRKPAASV